MAHHGVAEPGRRSRVRRQGQYGVGSTTGRTKSRSSDEPEGPSGLGRPGRVHSTRELVVPVRYIVPTVRIPRLTSVCCRPEVLRPRRGFRAASDLLWTLCDHAIWVVVPFVDGHNSGPRLAV